MKGADCCWCLHRRLSVQLPVRCCASLLAAGLFELLFPSSDALFHSALIFLFNSPNVMFGFSCFA